MSDSRLVYCYPEHRCAPELRPGLHSLYTNDCTSTHNSNQVIKFADDTTIVGLISDLSKAAYREEVRALSAWCQEYDRNLNTKKTKKIIIDFRKSNSTLHTELCIDEDKVNKVSSFKFLGVRISADLTWSLNSSHRIKKAQKRPFHLRLPQKLLMNFYRCTIKSVLTYSMGA